MNFWYRKYWLVEEFVNDIGLKAKDTTKESKDVLLVRHIWNMMEYNVLVAKYIFVESEKVND